MPRGVAGLAAAWALGALASATAFAGESGLLTLEQARRSLAQRVKGEAASIGLMNLEAFNFSWDLGIGRGLTVLAISCDLKGGLVAFRDDGSLIASEPAGEITSVQLFDLNEDGIAEVVTEEVAGRGTGVLMKNFCLYSVTTETIKKLWSGESYFRSVPLKEERVGFVRFDPSGGGRPRAQLVHLVRTDRGRFDRRVLEMIGQLVRERAQ
jgi:hypothetical protein